MPDGLLDVSPSPLWGGVRGGGSLHVECSAIPPSLSLPHEGEGTSRPTLAKNIPTDRPPG